MLARPVVAAILVACLWDHDTIRMEREAFPGLHELLAGKFTRHSRTYYEWRILDREKKRVPTPDAAPLLDDLAVAYDKTDRTDEAIELMRKSLDENPGRYETLANLGTFLIHAGKLEEGLAFIRKAIDVNPDAHFGREIVQARLVEYVLGWRKIGRRDLPLRPTESDGSVWEGLDLDDKSVEAMARCEGAGFVDFRAQGGKGRMEPDVLAKGLVGMMFFGQHDHPVLAECLGDVLGAQGHRRLACRAYLKASYNAKEVAAVEQYRWHAARALAGQTKGGVRGMLFYASVELEEIEEQFKDELEEGREFFEQIAADEEAWAEAGLDLDEEFAKTYYEVGRTEDVSLAIEWGKGAWYTLAAALIALVIWSRRRSRRKRESTAAA